MRDKPTHVLLGQKQRVNILKQLHSHAMECGTLCFIPTLPSLIDGLKVLEAPEEDCCEYGSWHTCRKQVAVKYDTEELEEMIITIFNNLIGETSMRLGFVDDSSYGMLRDLFMNALMSAQNIIDKTGLNIYDLLAIDRNRIEGNR